MRNEKIRELVSEYCEESMLFDNPDFDNSIVGMTVDGNIIYDYDKMIQELVNDDNIPYDDAIDFIEVNTIRELEYRRNFYNEVLPIIIDSSFTTLLESCK